MSIGKNLLVFMGCFGVMFAAGCANKEVVKKDEQIGTEASTKAAIVVPAANVASPDQKKEELKKNVNGTKSAPSTPFVAQQSEKAAVNQALIEKIYFDFDNSDLSTTARDALTKDADVLMKIHKDAKIRIEGNCDERGSAEYNLALGERRAKAAAKYLTALGVQPDRLTILSYGKERPAIQGSDETAWAKNRRDEFVIQK